MSGGGSHQGGYQDVSLEKRSAEGMDRISQTCHKEMQSITEHQKACYKAQKAWVPVGKGWWIVEYLEYQSSLDQNQKEKAA